MAPQRKTRKKSSVLNVRSGGAVKSFEKLLSKGPLTIVYINAKWCGACHRFNDEVWSPLTKLKNRSVNLANVDSEFIGKTSLAHIPRKFYPTLMLVGKDKKPATFEDEEGNPTNAMPRNSTLSEDRETLSNLVRNPALTMNNSAKLQSRSPLRVKTTNRSLISNLRGISILPEYTNTPKSPFEPNSYTEDTLSTPMSNIRKSYNSTPMSNTIKSYNTTPMSNTRKSYNTTPMSNTRSSPMQFSPVDEIDKTINIIKNMGNTTSKQVMTSVPPDVESNLVSSQTKSSTPTATPLPENMKGGMLEAIRSKTASLKSIFNLRNRSTRKNRK